MERGPRVLPLADAGGLAAPAAAGVSAQVSGEPEGVILLDAVAAGRVPRPPDGPFHDWLRWRAREGCVQYVVGTGCPLRCSKKLFCGKL